MRTTQLTADKLIASHSYSPEHEHANCGVGLVASIDGSPRRDVVEMSIQALKNVWHRGAVDADGKTGDGAGIRLDIPQISSGPKLRERAISPLRLRLP